MSIQRLAALIRRVISWSGLMCLPHAQRIVPLKICVDMMGIEFLMSSINELHIAHLIQILFEPMFFFSFNNFVRICESSSTTSFSKNAFVLNSLSPRWVSTSMLEMKLPQVPEARSISVEWFETSCTPAWSSLFHCFGVGTAISFLRPASASFLQRLGTSVPEVGHCCCWFCQFLFNVTLGAGLGVSSLSESTRSPFSF